MTAPCPAPERLQRHLLGQLPDTEAETLERHLLDCPSCGVRLAALPASDPLLADLRRGSADLPTTANSSALSSLHDRLRPLAACHNQATSAFGEGGDPFSFLTASEHPGDLGRLGRFRVLSVLGQGGMGVVFEALDLDLERPSALKVMLPALAADSTARQRFLRERRAAASVVHEHVVPIFQTGEDNGVPFLAMPLLRGESLETRLNRQPPPDLAEALRIIREAARGLAAAHGQGLIHRDIKPDNIWLETADTTPRVRLLDFGLARAVAARNVTSTGVVVGTPGYMAPEQFGGVVDHRTDLFSLGIVLYRLLTGRRPFRVDSIHGYLRAVVNDLPEPPHKVNSGVPLALSALTLRLLDCEPDRRPSSAAEFLTELDRADVPRRRRRGVLVAGCFLGILAAGAAAYFLLLTPGVVPAPKTDAVSAGATSRGETPPKRPPVGPEAVLSAIAADLEATAEIDRPHHRYLTAAHLANRAEPATYAQLCQLLPRLEVDQGKPEKRKLCVLVHEQAAVFRVDLRDLGWDEDDWRLFLKIYPYGLDHKESQDAALRRSAERVARLSPHQVVFDVRADWLLFALTRRAADAQPLALVPANETRTLADAYEAERVTAETASAELGLDGPARLETLLREDPNWTKRTGLTSLLDGGGVPRSVWEARDLAVSPYQELSRRLGRGLPAN